MSALATCTGAGAEYPKKRMPQKTPVPATKAQMMKAANRLDMARLSSPPSAVHPNSGKEHAMVKTDFVPSSRSLMRSFDQPKARLRSGGFTLIELMVVLVIIGVLAALIVPNVLNRADDARVTAARTDVNNLMQALKLYKLDNQRFPSGEQSLQSLVARPSVGSAPPNWKPYLDKLPNDPWGRPYQYANPGIKGEIDIYSFGADGVAGGEGNDAEIGSWQ